jgi:hypothetical protein
MGTLSQPPAAPVTIAIPTGTAVVKVINLETRQSRFPHHRRPECSLRCIGRSRRGADRAASRASTLRGFDLHRPATSTIAVGSTVAYACTASLSNGTTASCASPSYTSSNPAVVSLAGNVATANAGGSVQIAASLGGSSASAPAVAVLNMQAP